MQQFEPNANQRLGRTFIFVAWFLGLGLLYMLFSDWFARSENPNQQINNIGSATAPAVRLQQNRQGHYVARGRINGNTVTFLLDTGATEVSVPGSLAATLGLRAGAPRAAHTANGTVTTYSTRLDSVELGPISLSNVSAHINPSMRGDNVLLGMSFLRALDFSQVGSELTLRAR